METIAEVQKEAQVKKFYCKIMKFLNYTKNDEEKPETVKPDYLSVKKCFTTFIFHINLTHRGSRYRFSNTQQFIRPF